MKITSARRSAALFTALTVFAGGSAFARTAQTKAPATVAVATTQTRPVQPRANAGSKLPAGPNLAGVLTPQQLSDAYDRYAQQRLHVDPAIVHTP